MLLRNALVLDGVDLSSKGLLLYYELLKNERGNEKHIMKRPRPNFLINNKADYIYILGHVCLYELLHLLSYCRASHEMTNPTKVWTIRTLNYTPK